MTTPPPGTDRDATIRRINEALQGPVIDVLCRLVPEVAALPRQDALELILDDIDLLHRCLVAFHAHLDQFRPLLVGRDGLPVEDSEARLVCGRSLDDVIAMVVRTAAKRHFRRRLDHDSRRLRRPPRPPRPRSSLFARLRALLAGRPLTPVRPKGAADFLYEAFGPRLRHDWQVPLVPDYSALSPGLVRRLGDRLLDYRVPEDVRRLKAAGSDALPPPTSVELMAYLGAGVFGLPPILPVAAPAAAPARTTAARREAGAMAPAPALAGAPAAAGTGAADLASLLTADGGRLRPDAFAPLLMDPRLGAALPGLAQGVRLGEPLGRVSAAMARRLVAELGLTAPQLAVFLMAAHAALGERNFVLVFGEPGRPDYLDRMIARARAVRLGPATPLPAVASFLAELLTRRT